ncbi:MerR family transcriptional regulator [Corynebacterium sp. YIM 101645]|uniref:MerR family transcriptional regulator n=1 Tax=Corynebacterium lemuris TaxID=1859292 RepID=A0ABT2FV60_9CORY|nr:MerR family transcriptional regulator [Corynebacterium lemuris]MCS5479130.1 MerR family transcriptional regulator [Corynebacterium lemuris]
MLIGEVSRRTGISARMLRHYEELGLVSPHARTSGGYRDYSEEDLRQLLQVEALRSLGLPLAHIAQLLAEGVGGLPTMIDRLIAETRQRINRDRELLRRLQLVRHEQPEETAELLEVIDVLRQLRSGDPAVRQRAALAAKNPRVRQPAVSLLTGMAGAGVDKLLETLADDADDLIRSRAILALSRRGRAGMVPRLLGMIVEGLKDVEAAELLGELAPADEKVVDELEELLAAAGTTPAARLRLVQALAEIPGPGAEQLLAALIDDEDRVVAGTARYILRQRGNG